MILLFSETKIYISNDPSCSVNKYRRFCKRCKAFKPIRAHHCSICRRCIVKVTRSTFGHHFRIHCLKEIALLSSIFSYQSLSFFLSKQSMRLPLSTKLLSGFRWITTVSLHSYSDNLQDIYFLHATYCSYCHPYCISILLSLFLFFHKHVYSLLIFSTISKSKLHESAYYFRPLGK